MEAASPPPSPAQPQQPEPQAQGGRAIPVVIMIVAALVTLFFGAVAIDLAGTETCEDALQNADTFIVECTEKSSANKALTVLISAATALGAIALFAVAFTSARTRSMSPLVRPLGIAVAAGAVIAIIL